MSVSGVYNALSGELPSYLKLRQKVRQAKLARDYRESQDMMAAEKELATRNADMQARLAKLQAELEQVREPQLPEATRLDAGQALGLGMSALLGGNIAEQTGQVLARNREQDMLGYEAARREAAIARDRLRQQIGALMDELTGLNREQYALGRERRAIPGRQFEDEVALAEMDRQAMRDIVQDRARRVQEELLREREDRIAKTAAQKAFNDNWLRIWDRTGGNLSDSQIAAWQAEKQELEAQGVTGLVDPIEQKTLAGQRLLLDQEKFNKQMALNREKFSWARKVDQDRMARGWTALEIARDHLQNALRRTDIAGSGLWLDAQKYFDQSSEEIIRQLLQSSTPMFGVLGNPDAWKKAEQAIQEVNDMRAMFGLPPIQEEPNAPMNPFSGPLGVTADKQTSGKKPSQSKATSSGTRGKSQPRTQSKTKDKAKTTPPKSINGFSIRRVG